MQRPTAGKAAGQAAPVGDFSRVSAKISPIDELSPLVIPGDEKPSPPAMASTTWLEKQSTEELRKMSQNNVFEMENDQK